MTGAKKILITGATGQVGGRLHSLPTRALPRRVVAGARSPEKAASLGVPMVYLDLDNPESMLPAFTGVDREHFYDRLHGRYASAEQRCRGHRQKGWSRADRLDGTMALVGVPAESHPSPTATNLIFGRRSLAGSLVGGIPETQDLLDFSAEHAILADIETITIDRIEDAFGRMARGDVKYRFVIDMQSLNHTGGA